MSVRFTQTNVYLKRYNGLYYSHIMYRIRYDILLLFSSIVQ